MKNNIFSILLVFQNAKFDPEVYCPEKNPEFNKNI